MFNFLSKREWAQPARTIYRFFLAILLVVVGMYFVAFLKGPYNALDWYVTATTEIIPITLHKFTLGLFQIELPADNYLINQYFEGSDFKFDLFDTYLQLFFFAAGLILLLAIISYFSTFWYTLFMGIFTVLLISMQFQQLQIFGFIGREPLIAIAVLYLGVTFVFQALKTDTSLPWRLIWISIMTGLVGIMIWIGAGVNQPFLHLANYGVFASLILSIIFIFLIAHEILYLILYLITQAKPNTTNRNAAHFIVFGLIYLANIFLIYFKNGGYIDWEILYVNAFVLLLISFFVGIWSFEKKEEAYGSVFSFYPYGGLLFIGLAIICFATIRFHMVMANDPILETLEDAIIFAHLGFGAMFFIYIIANFVTPLIRNMQVHKIVYKEANFPYATSTLASLVVVLALYFIANEAPLNQAVAGYYNLVGDLYLRDEPNVAKEFYIQSTNYGYNNHRAHYMLGKMDDLERNPGKAIVNYSAATGKQPTPFAFINLSNAYRKQNLYFDALFALQEGVDRFPEDGAIKNNLGMLFSQTSIDDSTLFYLRDIHSDALARRVASANVAGFYAKKGMLMSEDSTKNLYSEQQYLPIKANLLAYGNRTSRSIKQLKFEPELIGDSALNAYTLPYIINLFTAQGYEAGDSPASASFGRYPVNSKYRDQLMFTAGWQYYQNGFVSDGFRTIDAITFTSDNAAAYHHILGLMALEQRAPFLAAEYLSKAYEGGYMDTLNLVIANLEAQQVASAAPMIYQMQQTQMSQDLKLAINGAIDDILETSDQIRYLAIRYRAHQLSDETIEALLTSFQSEEFRQNAYVSLIQNYIDHENYSLAKRYFEQFPSPLTISEREYQQLEIVISFFTGVVEVTGKSLTKPYADLLEAYEVAANTSDNADSLFAALATQQPFFEVGVLAAARHFEQQGKQFEAYEIIRNAIDLNRYSATLIKAYVRQATKMKLDDYADSAIIRLLDLISEEEYKAFEVEINELRNTLQKSDLDPFSSE